jgi:TRAP-type C4-dicarboxylate transport system substrate-binding protein
MRAKLYLMLFKALLGMVVYPKAQVFGVTLKMATLAPRGTAYSVTSMAFEDIVGIIAKNAGVSAKVTTYWGGIMGSDSQMVEKSRLGQLDGGYFWTGDAQRSIFPESEILNFPFLLNREGGEGHFVRESLRKDQLEGAYKDDWVYMHFQNEGFGTLFFLAANKPVKTPDDLRALRCVNTMGLAETAFYEPLGIKTTPISPQDALPAVQQGMVQAGIGPIIYVVGIQATQYMARGKGGLVRPDIRFAICGVQITKRSLDKLPWPLKARLFYLPMPLLEYATYFITYDAEASTMYTLENQYKVLSVRLTGENLRAFTEPTAKAWPKYVGDKPKRKEFFSRILEKKRYFEKSKENIETHLVHKANQDYKSTNKNLRAIRAALVDYAQSGSLGEIKRLSDTHTIESWRLLKRIQVLEDYAANGSTQALKEQFALMMPDAFVDELFDKHQDELKAAFGTKGAIKQRVQEMIVMLDKMLENYPKSYQEGQGG